MNRFPVLAAVLATVAVLAPIGSKAQTGGYYAATPVAAPAPAPAPARTMLITNGTVWKWQDTAFTASKGPQRPAIMCELVVQRVGKLAMFSAGGTAFDAAALDKCNARAK